MLHLLVFCVGALTGGVFAWLCNLRGLYKSEQRADERARLTEIHIQGLRDTVRQLVVEGERKGITPAEKALLRELRARYAAQAEEGKMCKS